MFVELSDDNNNNEQYKLTNQKYIVSVSINLIFSNNIAKY